IIFEQEIPQPILQTPIEAPTEAFDYIQLLWIVYFVISGILILKILSVVLTRTIGMIDKGCWVNRIHFFVVTLYRC
ncbi:MAG: hypothetical protein RR068_05700, partial [Hafnia sp.]